jgi:hypothetical protein
MEAPAVPIPNIPKALPCHSFGYQTDVEATPTAKLVPTIPNKKLKMAKTVKEVAKGNKNKGIEARINKAECTILPPNLSVKIPIGNLIIEPVSTGIPKSHPICTTLQLKISLSTRKVTKTPFSVQHAKQIAKAKVFRKRIL